VTETLPPDPPAPDAIEPITGWRAWNLRRQHGTFQIAPAIQRPSWTPPDPVHAVCLASMDRHRAPERTCTCGVYAMSRPDLLMLANRVALTLCVVGSVALWGKVIEHEMGYRAEFAYPQRMRLVCPRCLWDGRPSVPDRVYEAQGGVWIAACVEHGPMWELRSLPAVQVQQRLLAGYGVEVLPIEFLRRG